MSSKKSLRFAVSGALLLGAMSACGGNEPQVNQAAPPDPEVNVAQHDPEPEPEPEVQTNEMPAPEDQATVNEIVEPAPSE